MRELIRLAELLRIKNEVESEIASIVGRPAIIGHVGEYIASRVFKVKLEQSASQKGIDGYFVDGALAGSSVNIKWYTKRNGLLDLNPNALADFYLVLTGPRSSASSSKGATLPWVIEEVFLFDSEQLIQNLKVRGVKVGVATSVVTDQWEAGQIYPRQYNKQLVLTKDQVEELFLFRQSMGAVDCV